MQEALKCKILLVRYVVATALECLQVGVMGQVQVGLCWAQEAAVELGGQSCHTFTTCLPFYKLQS